MTITLSVIKADVGGYVGHSESHPDVLAKARECLTKAKKEGLLVDYPVTKCGDDLQLIMTHQQGEESEKIHKLAWDTFVDCTQVAKKLKLHGAGQDLLSDAFTGTVKGAGPGVAEMAFEERAAETIIIFMADKSFDLAHHQANEMADFLRRHGPFEPHRLPLEEMEYTTMPQIAKKLQGRFVDLD